MSRILNLQMMEAEGAEKFGVLDADAASTCSYIACGSSTASCIGCCGHTTCVQTTGTTF